MRRLVLFLAVIGACVGCTGLPGGVGQGSGSSASDYEIVDEQDGDNPNLETKTFKVATESTEKEKLRRIAEEIKSENLDYDALNIDFYRDRADALVQGGEDNDSSITGSAIVVNNEQALREVNEHANETLGVSIFTDVDSEKLLNEQNGIAVVSFAEIEQKMEQMQQEMDQEVEQQQKEADQEMKAAEEDMKREMNRQQRRMEKRLDGEMRKMQEDMPKGFE